MNNIGNVILYISNIEYELYLWHLPILIQLANIEILKNQFFMLLGLNLLISILWSEVYRSMIKSITSYKINKQNWFFIIVICFCIMCLPNFSFIIKSTKDNFNIYARNQIVVRDELEGIVKNVNDKIDVSNNFRYIYFDNNDYEGTMNYYRIRYYLAPMKSIHWNSYAYNLNKENSDEVKNYLNLIDVDYVIVKNCPAIEKEFNLENSKNGYIFKKTNGIKKELKDILILVGEEK